MHDNVITKGLLATAAVVIIAAGLKASQALLAPLFLAIFIAVLCGPLLFKLTEKRVPTGIAIMMIVGLVGLAIFSVTSLISSSINQFVENMPFYQERLNSLSDGFVAWISAVSQGFGVEVSADYLKGLINPSYLMGLVGGTLSKFGNVMTDFILVLLVVIFILAEMHNWHSKVEYIAKTQPDSSMAHTLSRIGETIVHYMVLKFWVSLATGLSVALLLWVIGVDFPLLWALVAFLLNFIPNIGSIIAAVPAVLMALIQLGPIEAAFTVAAYATINVVMGNVVEPKIMGRGLNLSVLVVFLSLLLWGWILGPVGMFLSVPLTMVLKISMENFPQTHTFAVMLGGTVPQLANDDDSEVDDSGRV